MPRALLAALLLSFAAGAVGADAAFAVEVPAGKTKNVQLRNVPGGATMAVSIVTTGKLLVALVKEKGAAALFRATVERKLAFRVSVPERGHPAAEGLFAAAREGEHVAHALVHLKERLERTTAK